MENHEQQGDSLVDTALQAEDEQSSQKLWQEAADEYHKALNSVQDYISIPGVRLHRKLLFCDRKLGKELEEFKADLENIETSIAEYEARPGIPTSDLYYEKGYIKLEHGYYELSQDNYPKVQGLAEELIRSYERNEQRIETRQETSYILGEAYNLLGIALQSDKSVISKVGQNKEHCWKTAIKKLKMVNAPISRHAILNIEMNRALVELDQGNCDITIQILEDNLAALDPAYKLSNQQRLGIRYNLAAAYLDRLAQADLRRARELAYKNLNAAKTQNNFNELARTIELYGNIIKQEIKAAQKGNPRKQAQLVKQFISEYENYYQELIRLNKEITKPNHGWHTERNGLIIHRLFAEIYLLSGEVEKAKAELRYIESMAFPNTEQDQEESCLIQAVLAQSKRLYGDALNHLKHAKSLFIQANRPVMIVEVNLLCAELNMMQEKYSEAVEHLTEALKLASKFSCQNRAKRIKGLVKEINKLLAAERPPIIIFYSYSHKDEKLRNELETHLMLLQRQKQIEQWCDLHIIPGQEWAEQIDANLERADIILLLISADFLASDYCSKLEMPRALERHKDGSACVIPIIIREANWTPELFAKLQVLPTGGKAVTAWPDHDSAWKDVAKGIEKVIKALRPKPN